LLYLVMGYVMVVIGCAVYNALYKALEASSLRRAGSIPDGSRKRDVLTGRAIRV